MDINKIDHEKIIRALEVRGATLPCSRCGNNSFDIISTAHIPLQNSPNTIMVGGPSIPAVYVGCNKCGALTTHALNVLELLSPEVTS
jgi:hypothetical protein